MSIISPLPQGEMLVYTRSYVSKAPNPGAWAYFIRHGAEIREQVSFEERPVTRQYLDLKALVAALSEVSDLRPVRMVVYLTSAYVRDCLPHLNKWAKNNFLTSHNTPVRHDHLWKLLHVLRNTAPAKDAYWIKAAKKLYGTTYAYDMAKTGAKNQISLPADVLSLEDWQKASGFSTQS